jgi:hypothetical protein
MSHAMFTEKGIRIFSYHDLTRELWADVANSPYKISVM